jgi:hypothetical protein
MMVHRVACLASLVINIHQTKTHLVSTCGERTSKMKGSKDINVVRVKKIGKLLL